jgi:hypothetical protein
MLAAGLGHGYMGKTLDEALAIGGKDQWTVR